MLAGQILTCAPGSRGGELLALNAQLCIVPFVAFIPVVNKQLPERFCVQDRAFWDAAERPHGDRYAELSSAAQVWVHWGWMHRRRVALPLCWLSSGRPAPCYPH